MSDKDYNHIYYSDCPHFTIGKVDQWGESGYLFYEGMVYEYMEDRKDQYGRTFNPSTVEAFLLYAKRSNLEIPDYFLKAISTV